MQTQTVLALSIVGAVMAPGCIIDCDPSDWGLSDFDDVSSEGHGIVIAELSVTISGDEKGVGYVELLGEPNVAYSDLAIVLVGSVPDPGRVAEVIPVGTTDERGKYRVRVDVGPDIDVVRALVVRGFQYTAMADGGLDLDTDDDHQRDNEPWAQLVCEHEALLEEE